MTELALSPVFADMLQQVFAGVVLDDADAQREPTTVCEWGEQFFYIPETLQPIVLAEYQKALLNYIFPEPPGRNVKYPYSTVVWSEPKKSGKSAIGAMVGRWAAETWEDFNEIYCCANDLEQSQGRNFAAVRQSVVLPDLIKGRDPSYDIPTPVQRKMREWNTPGTKPVLVYGRNGTKVIAISGDYRGAAGGNPGMIIFSELWGYISEQSRRLYSEMTTVPTRQNSVRWIETYAGYLNESDLLYEVYERGMACDPVPGLEWLCGPDGSPEVRHDPSSGMFFFWSHTPRQDWQTPQYYNEQRRDLRPNEFQRLHFNMWVSRESTFISPDDWDATVSPEVTPLQDLVTTLVPPETVRIVIGVDASQKRDSTAMVGVIARENPDNPKMPFVDLAFAKIWEPVYDDFMDAVLIDLAETVGAELDAMHLDDRIDIQTVAYDPYQLHSIMVSFAKTTRSDVAEIPQTERRVQTDTCLLDLIRQGRLRTYPDPKLREHVLNAVAKQRPRGVRIDKEATSQKIDAAVALAMACWAALYHVPAAFDFVSV